MRALLLLVCMASAPACGQTQARPSASIPGASQTAPRADAPQTVAPPASLPAAAATEPSPASRPAPPDELASLRTLLAAKETEIARLRRELNGEQQRRFDRERQWHEFNKAIARLPLKKIGVELHFPLDPALYPAETQPAAGRPAEVQPPPAPPQDPLAARSAVILPKLNALLRVAGARGFDILELGRLGPSAEAPRWTGPVVLRLIGDQGRLAGSLTAARLRLECSRAARTLTLVLEDGYEARAGEQLPFTGGIRRILLPQVDPEVWVEDAPELFPPESRERLADDGLWELQRVREGLNGLLREDAASGYWQLHSLGGVVADELRDVQLMALDRDGKPQRVVFADRLKLGRSGRGIELLLEQGASLRGAAKSAFVDGRFRILLPNARAESFERARLPGFGLADRLVPEANEPEPQREPASSQPRSSADRR